MITIKRMVGGVDVPHKKELSEKSPVEIRRNSRGTHTFFVSAYWRSVKSDCEAKRCGEERSNNG